MTDINAHRIAGQPLLSRSRTSRSDSRPPTASSRPCAASTSRSIPGETLAIVGESGSGKSTTAHAIINLLPGSGRITGGQIMFEGRDLTKLKTAEIESVRGRLIGLVPQDPMQSLNPVWNIGFQVEEAIRANGLAQNKRDVRKRAIQVLQRGGPAGCRPPAPAVPAPVLGRHAPARAHRHRPLRRPEAADRRRADLGPRRDRAAPHPRSPRVADRAEEHRGDLHHARPRPRRRARREHRGHAPRQDRGVRSGAGDPAGPAAPVHPAPRRGGAEPGVEAHPVRGARRQADRARRRARPRPAST